MHVLFRTWFRDRRSRSRIGTIMILLGDCMPRNYSLSPLALSMLVRFDENVFEFQKQAMKCRRKIMMYREGQMTTSDLFQSTESSETGRCVQIFRWRPFIPYVWMPRSFDRRKPSCHA